MATPCLAVNENPPTSDPEPELLATPLGPIAVAREGSPDLPPLLCIHGIPGSRRVFRYLAPQLAGAFHVVRLEMPGFGASPPGQIDSITGWARVPGAAAEALGADRYLLLGHSFGGGAAILAAAKPRGELIGLVLLASMGARVHRGFGHGAPMVRAMTWLLALPLTRGAILRLVTHHYASRGLTAPGPGEWRSLHRQLRLIGSVRFRELGRAAARVHAPALLFHSEDDHLVQPRIARELARLFPSGRATFFPEGGHHLQKTRAQEIGREVCRALGRGGPEAADTSLRLGALP